VEPPASLAKEDEARTESDDDEETTDEWQSSGSDFIFKRVLVEVRKRMGGGGWVVHVWHSASAGDSVHVNI